jgi:hypothetical protein
MAAGEDLTTTETTGQFAARLVTGLTKQYEGQPKAGERAADDLAYLIRKLEEEADESEPMSRRRLVARAFADILRKAAREQSVRTPELLRVLAHVAPTAEPPLLVRGS